MSREAAELRRQASLAADAGFMDWAPRTSAMISFACVVDPVLRVSDAWQT